MVKNEIDVKVVLSCIDINFFCKLYVKFGGNFIDKSVNDK